MSEKSNDSRAIVSRDDGSVSKSPGKMSVAELLRKLPTAVLVPGVVLIFGALVADLMVADPLPIVDEAALLWGLGQSLKVLSERRRKSRATAAETRERDVVADVIPESIEAVGAQ